jgi:hypothetical protein
VRVSGFGVGKVVRVDLLENTWPMRHVVASQAPTSPTLAYGWKIARTPSMAITAARGWVRRRRVKGTL